MFRPLLFLAALALPSAVMAQDFSTSLDKSQQVMESAIECMDDQIKVQMRAQIFAPTADEVVDSALELCSGFESEYKLAISSEYISEEMASSLTADALASLKKMYLDHLEKQFVDPNFAEVRARAGLSEWRKCVTEKAREWSRLSDEASSIARAAVSACSSYKSKLRPLLSFEIKSKQLPAAGINEVIDTINTTLDDVALETVISERAKRLSSR